MPSTTIGISALFGSVSLLTVGRASSHPMQSLLVRAVPSFKVLGMGGPRHHRVSFSGRRSCFGTEQTPLPLRSHHCQAFESKKQKSSFPRRRCYRFCKLIDRGRKGGSPRERPLLQNRCIFGRADPSYSYCGWGTIGGDVYINDHHYVGRLMSEFPIPRTPEEGEP